MSTHRLIARKHAEWLSLIDISGPFLSMPILLESFPQGLEQSNNESEIRRRVAQAYEEWADNQEGNRPDPAIHLQWLRFLLEEVLEMRRDVILEGQQLPADLSHLVKEHGETLRPHLAIRASHERKPRLLVQLYDHKQDLEKALRDGSWKASPATRMMELLRNTGVRLGLVSNGRQAMLVDAPPNETTGFYTWDAALWSEEPLTLLAFRNLLGMRRFFGVPEEETIEELLTRSAQKQQEVTEQLGDQVRRAVETLVQMLDRLDKERQRTLLQGIDERQLYEAALTVMMRLVFLFSAEERGMLLLGDDLYNDNYAVSTMHKQLREQADQYGEEVMGLRYDAWSRLLATFRIVYGGVEHVNLRLPAYGGRLFDPDRFPFLEGRTAGTSWRDTPAAPLRIDNRTVLHLLSALQYLQVRVPGGGVEPRRLSFRGLDIEQIGHVYEGLLDHTAFRAETTILGLIGSGDNEPEVMLDDIEREASKGELALFQFLEKVTGRKPASLKKSLAQTLEKQQDRSRLMGACDNKQAIFDRILPYAGLVRKDTFGNYVVVTPGSFYVTQGSDRRSTGTHYTPRSLTEPIVQHALDPLVYIGPAEGLPQEQWQLRSAAEILDLKICDMAMGSGAFLVQSCRYLSEKLVEAWELAERAINEQDGDDGDYRIRPQITPEGRRSQGRTSEELLPLDPDERLATARRLIAERCLYGVDKNPMAVEMAKLSLWLITLAKNKPFTFLDHNLRGGDSLLGADERQLHNGSLDAKAGEISQISLIRLAMDQIMPTVIEKRRKIATLADYDVQAVQEKERLLKEADQALEIARLGGDLIVAIALSDSKRRQNLQDTLGAEYAILAKAYDEALHHPQTASGWSAKNEAYKRIRAQVDKLLKGRKPFHWPLEFPEVFIGKGDDAGFSAIMSNPPFQGGKKITGVLGTDYRDYIVAHVANGTSGSADLCAYFFLRASQLTRNDGLNALLATNTIAQGDTREVGLDQITASGWTIPRAIPSRKWPGEASLEVAHVWLHRGEWNSKYILDDKEVTNITPFLATSGKAQGHSYKLVANANKSFIGSVVLGMGFVLEHEDVQTLISKNTRNRDILFPYLNGEDVNTRPDQSPSRWVINFRDWPLERAEDYPDCMSIVKAKVKPERDRLGTKSDSSAKGYAKLWWQFARKGLDLYSTIAGMHRVLAIPLISKYMTCSWVSNNTVYTNTLCIISSTSDTYFALIQCTFHGDWVRMNGSSLRNDQRYTPTDCFETFPFPSNLDSLDDIGERYYTHRQSIMLTRQEGLTKTYNRFHDPKERAADIVTLRALHKEMDEAVACAYGWDDLMLEHGFHETKQGLRYTISEEARREVLDRLLLLNHQRHEEEVKAGLFATKGAKGKAAAKKKKGNDEKKAVRLQNGGDGGNGTGSAHDVIIDGDVEQGRLF
jgi:hypothetical protein